MKVWITKYALTKGIFETEADLCDSSEGMIKERNPDTFSCYFHKPHWHESLDGAIAQANVMLQKKRMSLEKQIMRLRGVSFGTKALKL